MNIKDFGIIKIKMNNRDLLKQYVDTGLAIGRTQYDKLPDNLKITYLRKRMIAANQDDDNRLSSYEILGVPDSYRGEMVRYLLNKMEPYFDDNTYNDDGDFNFMYGDINPVVKKLLKSSTWDTRIDDMLISLTQDEKFMKYLNKNTMYQIMMNVVNPSRVFSPCMYSENFMKSLKTSVPITKESLVNCIGFTFFKTSNSL